MCRQLFVSRGLDSAIPKGRAISILCPQPDALTSTAKSQVKLNIVLLWVKFCCHLGMWLYFYQTANQNQKEGYVLLLQVFLNKFPLGIILHTILGALLASGQANNWAGFCCWQCDLKALSIWSYIDGRGLFKGFCREILGFWYRLGGWVKLRRIRNDSNLSWRTEEIAPYCIAGKFMHTRCKIESTFVNYQRRE